jgi:N-methylhydantoinase B
MRAADIFQALPLFVFALALVGFSGPSTRNVILALAFLNIPFFLRLTRGAVLQVRSDRRTHRPFGLYGGSPGAPSENYMNPDGENKTLPSKFTMTIRRGDVFRHVLAGAGGWGDPLERETAAVLRDVRNELLSRAKAESDYGVVILENRVDIDATEKLRSEIQRNRGWREVPVVQREDPRPLPRKAA